MSEKSVCKQNPSSGNKLPRQELHQAHQEIFLSGGNLRNDADTVTAINNRSLEPADVKSETFGFFSSVDIPFRIQPCVWWLHSIQNKLTSAPLTPPKAETHHIN
jgi:hypothetical protein